MTLVELMITVALFGGIAVGMATLYTDAISKSVQTGNQAELSERIAEFTNVLESHLTNTTAVLACNCGAVGACIYNPAAGTGQVSGANRTDYTVLDFVAEDSNYGNEAGVANCFGGSAGIVPGTDTMIARGCKQRYRLVYTDPTPNPSDQQTGRPGELRLERFNRASGAFEVTARLPGAYQLFCGSSRVSSVGGLTNTPSMVDFHYLVRMKARMSNLNATRAPNIVESWSPADPEPRGFFRGTHRTLSGAIPYRNLTTSGVHFAKPTTLLNCTPDGLTAADGNCCSGYWDPGTERCTPMDQCSPRGTNVGTPTNLTFAQCCSHFVSAAGICQ